MCNPPIHDENEEFFDKSILAFRELFDAARDRNQLHFALALNPEMRGMQDAGWNTAHATQVAFREYLAFLQGMEVSTMRARIALSFYCHLSEASGYYEILKNMLRISDGEKHVLWPFSDLVQAHRITGNQIAPNSNKVLRDLAGHASTLGYDVLAEVLRDAFDPDVRNAYAHADYVVWEDGLRLPMRNGGNAKVIPWAQFDLLFSRGINFFNGLQELVAEYVHSYDPPVTFRTSLQDEPETNWTIKYDPEAKTFGISSGGE